MYSLLVRLALGMDRRDTPARLDVDATPAAVLDREDEQETLRTVLAAPPWPHLYLTGPRGTGKTLLARTVLEECPATVTTCYLCCRTYDSQFKVLQQVAGRLTGDEITDGYHTAQLQELVRHQLSQQDTVLVLDELDFLLDADGSDLLYFLSRLDQRTPFCLIGISASDASLATAVDDRTYSSLQPQHLHLEPYSEAQAATILTARAREAFPTTTITNDAVRQVATTTGNLSLGLHWLAEAAARDDPVTSDLVTTVRPDGAERYRAVKLRALTAHHRRLVQAIDHVATADSPALTGAVYDRYVDLCRQDAESPLSARRISDFLTQLELLGLVEITHHRGGATGRTREIRLASLQEL